MARVGIVEPTAAGAPLLEREQELAAVASAVDAAAAGHGGLVWVEGPAGIGKTSLLRAAAEHARARGMRVLSTRPGPLENELAFGAVRGLFEAAVTARPDLLAAGPARLAAPVVTLTGADQGPGLSAERLHGLYWLTVALSDETPLALLVDDVQWADEPSLRALTYLARRIEELPVVIVAASRSDVAAELSATLREDPATVVLTPAPLSRDACEQLVRAELGDATPAFLDACHDAAAGIPLLAKSLGAALRDDGVAPDESGLADVRRHAQAIVATSVLIRLRHLPPSAGALARAVAVLGGDAALRHAARLAGLEPDAALDAADTLVGAQLLAPGRPLAFTHPLVAEAVVAHMSVAERHRGHLQAARCLTAVGADPERVAAHLLALERLGDPWVATRLRTAAAAALAKGAPDTAVAYLQRAVAEPAAPADMAGTLVELGTAQLGANRPEGFATLRRVATETTDPVLAARAALAASHAARNGDSYGAVEDIVVAAATGLAGSAPELLAALHSELALAGRIGRGPAYPTMERVCDLAERATAAGDEARGLVLRLAALGVGRDPAVHPDAGPLAVRAAAKVAGRPPPDVKTLVAICMTLIPTERLQTALGLVDTVLDAARREGRMQTFGAAASMGSVIGYRLGRLREAEEDARLAARLVVTPMQRRHPLAWLLHCLVEGGRLDDAETEIAFGETAVTSAQLLMARGRLRLAQDRPAEALDDLTRCGGRLAAGNWTHPNHLPWRAWSAVALLRMAREDEARAAAAGALAEARALPADRARECARPEGVALWASGLVGRSAELLAEAVTVLAGVPAPVERARALVDLGATLRRANRRTDARAALEEALQLAHGCGAGGLVAEATAELAAAGVRPRRPAVTGPDALTPTERRIVERAAAGASNRDIAQALFVTPKTVENHLGNAYRKLGVSGRGELAGVLGVAR